MYSVSCFKPCVNVECKGFFLIQQHSKKQDQSLVSDHSQQCLGFLINLRVYNYNF